MARTRQISPDFFLNEELAECDPEARILFIGLWCLADREGKLEDRPKKIKAQILPYCEPLAAKLHGETVACRVTQLMGQLVEKNLIVRYQIEGCGYIIIPNFCKRQNVHPKEPKSIIPNPLEQSREITRQDSCKTVAKNAFPSCTSFTSIPSKESRRTPKRQPFVKPTLEEVTTYCQERNRGVSPEAWFNHYTSNGWKVGKNSMIDWKAAVRTWETNNFGNATTKTDEPFDLMAEVDKALKK